MKTLGKLKLNEFRKAELEKRELNTLRGGCSCKNYCSCSGSSDYANTSASANGTKNHSY